eukprot:TRINITY_DN12879_c0_g1_i1.p1 TRINITY_DN12879_c0_g1~~TRINITY_DN12879_c0_g1_i1.p1  ORF type:complete len:270 (+),score=99.20 TRINITY_DN12879_c0_g1_i1:22-810(+)
MSIAKDNIYETLKSVNEYLLMHFGNKEDLNPFGIVPEAALEFPTRCAQRCIESARAHLTKSEKELRVLDLGCAVGRSTFELARYFENVVGIDYSDSFVQVADEMKTTGHKSYLMTEEGHITSERKAEVDPSIDRARATFLRGDACNLDEGLGKFDVVLMANLLCRLPDPQQCLEKISGFINSGGLLVILTPCTWMDQFTPVEKFLGGYVTPDGVPIRTFDGVQKHLSSNFELIEKGDMPFLIREHSRKYQLTVSQLSIWKRK